MLDSGGLDCVREVVGGLVGGAEAGRGGVPPPPEGSWTPSRGLWRAAPAPCSWRKAHTAVKTQHSQDQ